MVASGPSSNYDEADFNHGLLASDTPSIPPSGQVARFIDELFTVTDGFSGVFRLTSTSEIAVVGLRARVNSRGELKITTTPPSNEADAATSAATYFSHIVDSAGWSTQFVLFSGQPGAASSGTLQFRSQSGEELNLVLEQASSDQLYVTNSGDGSISVVDLSSGAVVDTIGVGTNPALVSVLPSLNRVYIGDLSESTIHVINTTTREVVTPITLSRPSGGGDVNTASQTLFFLDLSDESPGTNMHVIDASTNTETADIPIGSDLSDIRIDAAANRGYVTDFTEGVQVIDLADNAVLNTIAVGNSPHGLAIDSEANIVYVTQVEGESVSVIDVEAGVIVDVISVGRVPQWIALNAARTKAYVTNEEDGTVTVIDTDTRIATNTISVGEKPFFILIDPNTDIAYVTNNGSNTVSVIDTESDTVVDTISVGTEPLGLAIITSSAQ